MALVPTKALVSLKSHSPHDSSHFFQQDSYPSHRSLAPLPCTAPCCTAPCRTAPCRIASFAPLPVTSLSVAPLSVAPLSITSLPVASILVASFPVVSLSVVLLSVTLPPIASTFFLAMPLTSIDLNPFRQEIEQQIAASKTQTQIRESLSRRGVSVSRNTLQR